MKMDWTPVENALSKEGLPAPCTHWPVDLKLTHVDCTPENTLVHFQGQYVTICELDYNILQVEIQNAPKTKLSPKVGEFCLVEDVLTSRWYRGRVQNLHKDLFDVFLLDHGNVLTVASNHMASIYDALLMLPPKIVCGFFANLLPIEDSWHPAAERFFSSRTGVHIQGYIHALLPYNVLILEVPAICRDLAKLNLGRHMDTETFLLLVEMLIEVPIQQNHVSVPDLLIEKQFAQEISFNSSSFWGFKNIVSLSESKLAVGQKNKMRVSAAVNSELFYCQQSSVAKDLEEMSKKLALAYESRSNTIRDKAVENLGLLCAIKGKDEKWHRGFVQCLPVNSQVRVVFIDYGYCESVKVENIHPLSPDFLQTPIMTFPCSITLGDKDEATKNQQLEILKNGLLGKELEVTVDDFNKEKNLCMVTLSVVGYNHNTAQNLDTDEQANTGVTKNVYKLYCYPFRCTNETNKVTTSENTVLFGEIQDGSTFEGYVEHVQSPHDFWMRTAKRNDSFESLMNKLSEYFTGVALNEEILENPMPGVLCCAMYEKDMHYYRALVVNKLEHGAEVFFIDFGNTEKVPRILIKKLPKQFSEEPEFAFSCSLAHVAPKEDVWTVATTEFFRRLTFGKAFLVHVVHKRNDTLVVELHERGTEINESISNLMTREGMAEHWRYNLMTSPVELLKKDTEIDKLKFGEGHLAKHSHKSVQQKSSNITTRQQHVHADKTIHEKHFSSPKSKINELNIFRFQNFQPGAEISVICSYVNSPSEFWCQNKKHTADLERLMDELEAFYSVHAPEFQPHSTCCAVKLQQNNRWYRGCTIGGNKEKAEVILVDYGKVVTEKMQNIRALMPEFLELQGQAFRCSLYNLIEPVGNGNWSEEACTLFKDFVSESSSSLTCKIYSQLCVVNKGLCNVVDLHTPHLQVATHLVNRGVAVQIQSPKPLVPSAYPCSFVYSSFNVSVGDKELVYATHVTSPWEIYVQLDRNGEVIEQLMERAAKESEELLKSSYPKPANPGSVCLVRYFSDRKWYRSLVWPAQSNLHMNVFFVDYGNKQVAEKCNILPIPRHAFDLLSIPMQAIRCTLSDITEGEHLPVVTAWLEKAILNKALQVTFVAKDDNGHFICDLFDENVNISKKVKELLAIHEQKEGNTVRKPHHVNYREDKKALSDKYKTKKKTNVKNCNKLQRAANHEKGMQSNRHKKSSGLQDVNTYDKPRYSEKLNQKPKVQAKKMQKNKCSTIGTLNVSKTMPNINDLPASEIKPGFRAVGFISHSISFDSFFIQMEDDEEDILEMRELLNSKLFTENMKNITWDINVGDVFAAEYKEDLALYRAMVTTVKSRSTVSVEFIDYGNTAVVARKKMYLLTSNFLVQPRLSVPCILKRPHPFENPESFIKEAHGKPLIVEFMQNLGHAWEVCVSIHEQLPKAGIHDADNRNDEVPDSGQAKQSEIFQELITVTEAQKQYPSNSLLSSEKTKLEKPSMNCEISTNAAVKTKEIRVRLRKLHLYKPLQKNQGHKKVLKRSTKGKLDQKQNYSKNDQRVEPDFCNATGSKTLELSLGLPVCDAKECQDIQECKSALVQPVLQNAYPENIQDEEGKPQHLFFAPVKMDHEYIGFAAAVTTPGEFYIVLEDFILNMTTVSNMLQNLPEELYPLPESHLIPGIACLMKSPEKGKWCRVEIVHCDEVSLIVNLVDYGHYAHFPQQEVQKLKRIPLELAALPKITYPCSLRGIKPAGTVHWSDDAIVFFQQRMCQRTLQITFRQCFAEVQWDVDVIAGDTNIAKELVKAGYACYMDKVLGIKFAAKSKRVPERVSPDFADNVSEVGKNNQAQILPKKDETKNTFGESCDVLASGMEVHQDQISDLTQCMLM